MPPKTPNVFLAEWFWVDRWMGSSAFLLPIEARGLYREMLTQAWRRGAQLPNDPEAIKRATACSDEEWSHAWPLVKPYWRQRGKILVNDTQLEIYAQSLAVSSARSAAGKRGNAVRWGGSNGGSQGDPVATRKPDRKRIAKPSQQDRKRGRKNIASISISRSISGSGSEESSSTEQNYSPPPTPPAGGFERFWQEYPKKKARGSALRAWSKLKPSPELVTTILAAVARDSGSEEWYRERGQFIPYPASWLNARRWEDEAAPPHVTPTVEDWSEECQRLHLGLCGGNRHQHMTWMLHGPLPSQQKAYDAKKKANGGVRA